MVAEWHVLDAEALRRKLAAQAAPDAMLTDALADYDRMLAGGEYPVLMLTGTQLIVMAMTDKSGNPLRRTEVLFSRREGAAWEPWSESSTPKPPRPEDAPFHPAGRGMAQWPTTGVHFHAIRFPGGREWDAVNGWRDSTLQMVPVSEKP